jgi:hypothetical protein
MKRESKFVSDVEVRPAWKLPRMLSLADTSARAFRYCQAAQRDERNGFPFTAAMEWQKAADLFSPIVPFVELCWCNWERITCLPRHLAEPIIDQLQLDTSTSQRSVPLLSATEPSFLLSA